MGPNTTMAVMITISRRAAHTAALSFTFNKKDWMGCGFLWARTTMTAVRLSRTSTSMIKEQVFLANKLKDLVE